MFKRTKALEDRVKSLEEQIKIMNETLRKMWDETHPQTMGGK